MITFHCHRCGAGWYQFKEVVECYERDGVPEPIVVAPRKRSPNKQPRISKGEYGLMNFKVIELRHLNPDARNSDIARTLNLSRERVGFILKRAYEDGMLGHPRPS